MAETTGVYVCMTKGCEEYGFRKEFPWDGEWELAKRQKKCRCCRKNMLLVSIKRPMTEAVKARLVALAASRKEQV